MFKKSLIAAAVGAATLGAAEVRAQSPWYLGVGQAFTRETNLFRAPTGSPEVSDTYSTTSLLGGLDLPVGRQRLYADGVVRFNRYSDNEQLDNTGHNLSFGIDWETIENLSGRIGYVGNRTLNRFGADEGPAITSRNIENSEEVVLRGQYGRAGLLGLEAGYTYRRLEYSAPEYSFLEFKQGTANLGLVYRPSGLLTLGIGYRRTDGEYPFAIQTLPGVFAPDDFTRDDIDLTAVWVPTGQSTIRARLSYTTEEHRAIASRDVSGTTGAISWEYKPTGKLAFTTELIRDTGAQSSFSSLDRSGANSVGDNSQIATSLLFRGAFQATAKVQLELTGRYVERDLVNTFALATGGASTEAGSDKYAQARLALNYQALRSLLLGCAYGYEKRGSRSSLTYSYDAALTTCFAEFKTQ